ncbi:MAG: hypothetical protein JSR77_17005 [Planctomycetes bacterium]|nr:hypothetical protein [Planctomycetota bacterium]
MIRRALALGVDRSANSVAPLEQLESRTLLAGFTLVTHGYEALGDRPAWISTMANAIANVAGSSGASVRPVLVSNDTATGLSMTLNPGAPTITQSERGEVVGILDWADASNNFQNPLFERNVATDDEADMVANRLLSNPVTSQWLSSPIHLIGHSRGASVMTLLAEALGRSGIWVNQLTLLDPHPTWLAGDPSEVLPDNVAFTDNYYETGDLVAGSMVPGAMNVVLNSAHGTSIGHTQTHAFYHGTIQLSATNDGDNTPIDPRWYETPGLGPRDQVGFARSRLRGYVNLADTQSYVHVPYSGGTNFRTPVVAGSQWPNIDTVGLSTGNSAIVQGNTSTLEFVYGDRDSGETITAYADVDDNPYNNNEIRIGTTSVPAQAFGSSTVQLSTTPLSPGSYRLLVVGADEVHRRFAYLDEPLTVSAPPPPPPPPPMLMSVSAPSSPVFRPDVFVINATTSQSYSVRSVYVYADANRNGAFEPGIDTRLSSSSQLGAGSWTSWLSSRNLPAGSVSLLIVATAANGATSTLTASVTIANSPPTLQSVSAKPTLIANAGDKLGLSIKNAKDFDGRVQSVSYFIDADGDGILSRDSDTLLSVAVGGKFSSSILTPALAPGVRKVFAIALDNDGGWSTPVSTLVTINSTPTISSMTASAVEVLRRTPFTISVIASDSDDRVKAVEFYIDSDGNGLIDPRKDRRLGSAKLNAGVWSLRMSISNPTSGSLTILGRALDSRKGVGAARAINVVVL